MKYLDFNEESFFLISKLDYTQEVAVKLASEEDNLIIKGPINSGKKETIINIISNNLYQGKRVLLISKNTAALKYIYERLNYIDGKIALLSDSPMDLNVFYENLLELLNNISKNTGKTTLSKIKVLSRDIDKKIEMLNSINELFYSTRYCGLNLLDMYRITEKKLNSSEDFYKYYKIYRIKKPFTNYKYDELNKSVERLLNENDINNYVKYRRFKNNKLFSKLIKNISRDSTTKALSKINSLLNNPLAFELPIYDSKYTEDFIKAFLINNKMTFDDIKDLAQTVNLKYNSYILNNDHILRKWNPAYWLKRKSIIQLNDNKKTIFNNIGEKIYLEFLDNLENLNIYIKTFAFIKDIVNEDEYKKFINTLLIHDDIVDYFKNLRNTLTVYESFENVTVDIESFNDIENELLTYCYNNLEKKEEMKSLLKSIPNLYLLYSIEEIETRENDILYYYKNFEIILKDIQLAINTKISFIPSGIRYVWNNKISHMLEVKNMDYTNIVDYLKSHKSKLEITDFLNLFKSVIFDIYPCFILDYNNVNKILPDIKGLFDVIIFYDGSNIYEKEIQSDIYIGNKHIITDEYFENSRDSLLDSYSHEYTTTELKYTYGNLNHIFNESSKFNSYLQKELYETFTRLGYKIETNINISGYDINLVFYDNNYKIPILALECDDSIYNTNYTAREVDIYRRSYLESIGVNIIRIWSRDWWLNKKSEIKRIKDIVQALTLEH